MAGHRRYALAAILILTIRSNAFAYVLIFAGWALLQ